MKLYQNDYKGKWFCLADEPDEMYGDIGTIEHTDVDLDVHADNCLYYGIPMYYGASKEFKEACDEAMKRAVVRDEAEYEKRHKV